MVEGDSTTAFEEGVRAHDAAVRARGLVLWVGAEPTYTLAESIDPEWIGAALGEAKRLRSARVAATLHARSPGAAFLRSVGRQYPEEERPRWSFGLLRRRDGIPVWSGPPDPFVGGMASVDNPLEALADALVERLRGRDRDAAVFRCEDALPLRVLVGAPGARLDRALVDHPEARAGSVHDRPLPVDARVDPLLARGAALVRIGCEPGSGSAQAFGVARVELPAIPGVEDFLAWLDDLGSVSRALRLDGLVVAGYPPPVDASVAWATVTPDPGVVEINMAPADGGQALLADLRAIDDAVRGEGLVPYRVFFNGEESDSGGGGHVTLGGPSPERSPLVERFRILPRLVRYLVRHPSLSYLFVGERVGSGSESPRVDEVVRESLGELRLGLALLERAEVVDPHTLWASLAPFLTDRVGNTHRAEVNVEKLWNPFLPGRGRLGLVELRAFRMAPTPEHLVAEAVLLRAVVAALAERDFVPALVDWGAELHDRFALRFHLERDLSEVLADLDASGLGLAPALVERLRDDGHARLAEHDLDGTRLVVRQGLEFRPLVGDLSAQQGSSRLVDPSTARVELWLPHPGSGPWSAVVDGHAIELPGFEGARVVGIRYRAFEPMLGLHPRLPRRDPLVVDLHDQGRDLAWRLSIHHWRPDGHAYPGLPPDLADARARRRDRVLLTPLGRASAFTTRPAPPEALTPWALDTRALPPA